MQVGILISKHLNSIVQVCTIMILFEFAARAIWFLQLRHFHHTTSFKLHLNLDWFPREKSWGSLQKCKNKFLER